MCSKKHWNPFLFQLSDAFSNQNKPGIRFKRVLQNHMFHSFSSHGFHLSPAEIDPKFISFLFRNLPHSGFHRSASNSILQYAACIYNLHISLGHSWWTFCLHHAGTHKKTTTVPRHQSVHEDHVPHPKIYLPWWGPGWNNSKTKSKLIIMWYDQIWGGVPV